MGILQLFVIGDKSYTNWMATLSGSGSDVFTGVAVYADAIYAAGYTNSGSADVECFLAKFSTGGALQWQKSLVVTGTNSWSGVAADANGCYTAGYYTVSTLSRPLLAKYDSGGTLQWQRQLFGAEADQLYCIGIDPSSNVYIGGFLASEVAATGGLIAKYNSSGTLQWQRSLGGTSASTTDVTARGCTVDASGNLYIVGDSNSQTTTSFAFIAKYNTSGTLQWQRSLGTTSSQMQLSEVVLNSAETAVYVTGIDQSTGGAGSYDVLVAKFDTAGSLTWQRRIGAATNDLVTGLAIDSSENIYVAADTNLVKYNSSGTFQWHRTFTGASTAGLAVSGTDLILCGLKGTDAFLAKLPTDGTKTGTYGGVTYATGTWTALANPTHTLATRTLTDSARTLTSSTPTLTDTTTTFTDSVVEVP